MKVLVVGSGGREHALAWRLSQDAQVEGVWVYPGNPGMTSTPKVSVISEAVSFSRALEIVRQKEIQLVVIGPEKYLYEAWVDQFKEKKIPVYGPSQAASFLEESKIKSKLFMKKFKIETADFVVVHDLKSAREAIDAHSMWSGFVLKLSGPALGKGVIVANDAKEAKTAAEQFFNHRPPGIEEGMVIENKVSGKEVSLFYVCSGEKYKFLASACDHKRLKDHDQGPNTGGMGAYSPCYWIDDAFLKDVETRFVMPTLQGMISEGTPFTGTLFLGLMVNAEGASLLEYNVRFGDPETQTFLPLIEGDFSGLLLAAAKNESFLKSNVMTKKTHSVHVVKAAKGYPGLFGQEVEVGQPIEVRAEPVAGSQLFYAGVKEESGKLLTGGGRVCGVTATGSSLSAARSIAYEAIGQVRFSGEQFRTDIGATP